MFNAVMTYQQAHPTVVDVALLRQLRHLVDIETAVDYHNRSEPVTQRILARSDSDVIWTEIYNQYIPTIAVQATAHNPVGAWVSIMTMLAEVESRY
jgi:methylmalonyl-CoA mutase cobalamin-binding subunit